MTTARWREDNWGPPCQPMSGRVTVGAAERMACDSRAVPAFAAMAAIVAWHGYPVLSGQTGIFNCRHIGNDESRPWSAHAWGTAVDLNWKQNPDGNRLVTNIPAALRDDLHALRCRNGNPVFRWGGDWDRDPRTGHSYYDAMHWELICTPEDLQSGLVLPAHITRGRTMRIAGSNRYATSVAIARHRFAAPAVVYLAATGSPEASQAVFDDGPTLLVDTDTVTTEVMEYVADVKPLAVIAVGGVGVVSEAVADRVRRAAGIG